MKRPLSSLLTGLTGLATGLLTVGLLSAPAPVAAAAAAPPKWTTTVFASVPAPGYPAYVFKHRNSRVYAGTYVNSSSRKASKVFEWTAGGTLQRSWALPRQLRDGSHGVQVANQTHDGKLVLLETSRSAVITLDIRTGRFRTIARLPGGGVPNYATWGPGGALYVTDYGDGVIWKVSRRGGVTEWFRSTDLDGVEFGTTGIVYRPQKRDFLISQQTSQTAGLPTDGHLFRLGTREGGRAGVLSTLWTSQPGELPDGFGIGRSGHIYIAMAGLTAQLVELSASGRELDRFPDTPFTGENGSRIPFDTPCSATFSGTTVLVANQSAVQGDPSHQAILAVEVGERGRAPYLPKGAGFR
ncbi:hypothetical protein NPS01_00900 [Nocardioides psychrotolerans]|uniref:Sugar lactone lactonase YvrE n=1 Tax=Nocardioides psychrotolerans TaxID=1005945 RepID=A0A1I3BVJ7_9ACTN|nr:hypothetical protein [Nocardioides psychrotolerans]GEP36427.1 hypothetical protein NPS01_00900 [Nocardioides psychrotolerans]SFH66317.1 Sugar lactone lactonase YvrE [Nocardioides psychrotolerans]